MSATNLIYDCYYWCEYEKEVDDWHFELSPRGFWQKLTDPAKAIRFDGNAFSTNAFRHPAMGGISHLTARLNGFGPWASLGFAAVHSTKWEYLDELPEQVSLNDLIHTPFGGPLLGEPAFRNIEVLKQIRLEDGGLRFAPKEWVDMRLSAGVGVTEVARPRTRLGFRSEVNTLEQNNAPGKESGRVSMGEITEIAGSATLDAQGIEDLTLYAKTAVALWRRKRIDQDGSGTTVVLGYAPTFDLDNQSARKDIPLDRLCTANLAGTSIDLTYFAKNGVTVRAKVDVSGNLAMVQAYAGSDWRGKNPDRLLHAPMERETYYHALGVAMDANIQLSFKGLELSAGAKEYRFSSIDWQDSRQELLAGAPHMSDAKSVQALSVGYALGDRWALSASVRREKRSGSVADSTASNTETNGMLTLERRFGNVVREKKVR